MPIPLGILAQFRQAEAGDFVLLETQLLTSNQASVTFSGLAAYASQYKHLQIRATTRNDNPSGLNGVVVRFNGDSGSNYAQHVMFGNGSSVQSVAGTSQTFAVIGLSTRSIDSDFGAHITDILDPFVTTKNTTTRSLVGTIGGATFIQLRSNAWLNTASLTSMEIISNLSNFTTGSRFSLYGVK